MLLKIQHFKANGINLIKHEGTEMTSIYVFQMAICPILCDNGKVVKLENGHRRTTTTEPKKNWTRNRSVCRSTVIYQQSKNKIVLRYHQYTKKSEDPLYFFLQFLLFTNCSNELKCRLILVWCDWGRNTWNWWRSNDEHEHQMKIFHLKNYPWH